MKQVDLIWLNGGSPAPVWNLGTVVETAPTVERVRNTVLNHLERCNENSLLFWDSRLPSPDPAIVSGIHSMRGDAWHAGLKLGFAGQPSLIHAVESIWMLNSDPDPTINATSWRLSLRAALIPADVFRKLGFIRREFQTLDGASLELGHRLITHGVLLRHTPDLIPVPFLALPPDVPFDDELRFIYARYGSFWAKWAVMRSILNRRIGLRFGNKKIREASISLTPKTDSYRNSGHKNEEKLFGASVSVIIPTLDRYQYLRTLLGQLRTQTVMPLEILVIDQTAHANRDHSLLEDFKDLPLRVLYRDEAGQCSSRNAGLQTANGEYILFLDDDSEIPDDLIDNHLRTLHSFHSDASSGVAEEAGAGPIPDNFCLIRASDVFPTNNTLIHNSVLLRSGLFDLAYERGQRADGDLGMRVYLSGALMVLNPQICIYHHHAPRGGLRSHKARVITYASSRNALWQRHLPSATEIYLALRYFSPEILREMLWLRVAGTFRSKGSLIHKMLKLIFALILLPDTLLKIKRNSDKAKNMLKKYPQIPNLQAQKNASKEICAP